MPTDTEVADLTTDAELALRDLELLTAIVLELVERAQAGRLTTGVRRELAPEALARVDALRDFVAEQVTA